MIQLATEPTASRTSYRPAAKRSQRIESSTPAWPQRSCLAFPQSVCGPPAQQDGRKNAANDSGS